jgi:hypothetical protein
MPLTSDDRRDFCLPVLQTSFFVASCGVQPAASAIEDKSFKIKDVDNE